MKNLMQCSKIALAVISAGLSMTTLTAQAAEPSITTTQSAQVIGLLEAWQMALDADTQWKSAQASLAAEREILPQAKAALLPSLGTSAAFYEQDYDPKEVAPGSNVSSYEGSYSTYTVELRQPVLNLAAIKGYASSKKTMDIVNYQLEAQKQALILRVSEAYFNLLLAEESVTLAESELKAIQRQLDQTQQRFKVGLVSKTDVLEAQAASDQTRVTVAQALNDRAIALENLSIIVGQQISDVKKVQANIPLEPMSVTSTEWVDQVLAGSIDFKLAQLNQEISGLARDAEKASYWPTIDAVANYSNADQINETATTNYGLEATWTPFQGGGLRSRIREAELRYQSAATDVAGLRQTLSRDARNLYQTLRTNIVQIEAQKQSIVSSESALEATQAGYEVGTRNIVDVLDAQQAVFQAKRNFAEARYTWIINRLNASLLDSSLSESNLTQVDGWLIQ